MARQQPSPIDPLEPRRHLAATTVLHINAGGDAYTDHYSRTFSTGYEPAAAFSGGSNLSASVPNAATLLDPALFGTARIGEHFTFTAPVTNGRYALFVEFLDPISTAAGERIFDVTAEGQTLADNLDLFARVGNAPFAIERDLTIGDGSLNLSFDADVGDALVSAIVLLPLDVPNSVAPFEVRNTSDVGQNVQSQSRLRQIAMGLFFYASNHRGAVPNSIADLVSENDVTYDVLANPRSNNELPRGVLSALEQTAWSAAHEDYLYVKPTVKLTQLGPDDPLFYENPTRAAGDINVAWADGHVSQVTRAQAATMFGFDANAAPTGALPPPSPVLPRDPILSQSQSRIQAIAAGIRNYANAHSNRIPTRLGQLVESGYVSAAQFSNPRLGPNAATPAPAGSTPAEAGAWVDAHSDFALTNAAQRLSSVSATETLVYEKPAGLTDGTGGELFVANGGGAAYLRETRWALESIADQAGPIVLATTFDSDASALRFRFDEDATGNLAAGDLVLINLTTGQAVPSSAAQVSYDLATQVATFSFPGLYRGALPDGNYVATLAAGSMTDAWGTAMPEQATASFFSFAGDLDHDRDVDFSDLVILARHYGQSAQPFSAGNIDRDSEGRVDFDDLVILAQKFGRTLPAPVGAISVAPTARPRKMSRELEI